MQTLYVMQGIPGSGKSTVAKQIQAATGAVICSTDDYFTGADGVYRFDPTKLAEYHKANQDKAKEALEAGKSVIVDNTNILRIHCKPYVLVAVSLNLPVVFVRCEGRFSNVHSVPESVCVRMKMQMETLSVEAVLSAKEVRYGNALGTKRMGPEVPTGRSDGTV